MGHNVRGAIAASYATGNVDGGAGNGDLVGGLVGDQTDGTIRASYATGDAAGGDGSNDSVGSLVGTLRVAITASWGFGGTSMGQTGSSGNFRPSVISSARVIRLDRAGYNWNSPSMDTFGAWDFGSSSQNPALNFSDYDGSGSDFHCTNDSTNPPANAIIVPDCGGLIPGQGRTQSSPIIIGGHGRTLGGSGDFGSADFGSAWGEVIVASHYASASLWVPEGD